MSVTGLPTSQGIDILTSNLRENVTKFCLYGTDTSSGTVSWDENSTLSSLSAYLLGKFDIARAYFDDNGTLTFECPIPYDFSDTKWVGAAGIIYVDANLSETLVSVSPMPKFQKTAGIGGTIRFKVPIAGAAGDLIFEQMPYVSKQELDTVLNEIFSGMSLSLDEASVANKEILKTLDQRNQTGIATIYNRGVVKGCVASKSADSTRNISLSSGLVYMHGRLIAVPELINTANVPPNTGSVAKDSYLFLWEDINGDIQVDCTTLDTQPPENSITLYRINVPAGSTEATDPYIGNCTLNDVRVLEPKYPTLLANAPLIYVPLEFDLLDDEYLVQLDILDFEGGGFQLGYCYVGDRASNGFSIYLNGTADKVRVRYNVLKNKL